MPTVPLTTTTLFEFPDDLLTLTFDFLIWTELISISQTCKHFYQLNHYHKNYWEQQFEKLISGLPQNYQQHLPTKRVLFFEQIHRFFKHLHLTLNDSIHLTKYHLCLAAINYACIMDYVDFLKILLLSPKNYSFSSQKRLNRNLNQLKRTAVGCGINIMDIRSANKLVSFGKDDEIIDHDDDGKNNNNNELDGINLGNGASATEIYNGLKTGDILCIAIGHKSVECINYLIDNFSNEIEMNNDSYKHCLRICCKFIDVRLVTPFQVALGELSDIKLIEKFFGDLTKDIIDSSYYLHFVCFHGNDILLGYFIRNKNGNIIGRNNINDTPLMVACGNYNKTDKTKEIKNSKIVECISVLLSEYYSKYRNKKILTDIPSATYVPINSKAESILFWFAKRYTGGILAEHILSESIKIGMIDITKNEHSKLANKTDCNEETPLAIAIRTSNVKLAKILIFKYNANVNDIYIDRKFGKKKSMLYLACENRENEIAVALLARNADTEKGCQYENEIGHITPLMLAAKGNNEALVAILIKHGANIFAINEINMTAFSMAVKQTATDVVKFVYNHIKRNYTNDKVSKYINLKDKTYGDTPYIMACRKKGDYRMLVLLVNFCKVDITQKNNDGKRGSDVLCSKEIFYKTQDDGTFVKHELKQWLIDCEQNAASNSNSSYFSTLSSWW